MRLFEIDTVREIFRAMSLSHGIRRSGAGEIDNADDWITITDMSDAYEQEQWWVASLGDTLIWARLRVLDSGIAEVLDAAGETLRYDDEDSAHAALLDAEFRAYDGLDEDDAIALGFDLESVAPPEAESDDDLLPLMTEKLLRGHA
jgi:hypothetical protein